MKKRISRRELKEQIRNLKFDLNSSKCDLDSMQTKYDDLKKRFADLGSKAESYDVKGDGIECIEVFPQAWGNYFCLARGLEDPDEIDHVKKRLISDIANGLMENNMIQFIMNDSSPLGKTMGAKLYVVPWDKMVRKIVIRK